MKVTKVPLEDDCEFNITLTSIEVINLVSMDTNTVMQLMALILKATEVPDDEVCDDREVP